MTSMMSIKPSPLRFRTVATLGASLALLAAMAISTKVVRIGSEADRKPGAFSVEEYGTSQFPVVQAAVEERAVGADILASAIAQDKATAVKQYGVAAGVGPEMSVKFTGVAGAGKSGVYPVAVENLPEGLQIRVQTGPAINGTDLRDATGAITFGQFTNQIEYQNAGAALNNEMKKQVLSKIDARQLQGKSIAVVGVFKLINAKSWLVTPVRIEVQ